jgi:hypothetical protein
MAAHSSSSSISEYTSVFYYWDDVIESESNCLPPAAGASLFYDFFEILLAPDILELATDLTSKSRPPPL